MATAGRCCAGAVTDAWQWSPSDLVHKTNTLAGGWVGRRKVCSRRCGVQQYTWCPLLDTCVLGICMNYSISVCIVCIYSLRQIGLIKYRTHRIVCSVWGDIVGGIL